MPRSKQTNKQTNKVKVIIMPTNFILQGHENFIVARLVKQFPVSMEPEIS
jgi:hypothetical protein